MSPVAKTPTPPAERTEPAAGLAAACGSEGREGITRRCSRPIGGNRAAVDMAAAGATAVLAERVRSTFGGCSRYIRGGVKCLKI
jgi:hypothetical protein